MEVFEIYKYKIPLGEKTDRKCKVADELKSSTYFFFYIWSGGWEEKHKQTSSSGFCSYTTILCNTHLIKSVKTNQSKTKQTNKHNNNNN